MLVEKTGLHIGAGDNPLPGWINCDLHPRNAEMVHLDATQPFQFDDGSFDLVFSEHMIEHVDYQQGLSMLKECFRTMKSGGLIRITTPDMLKLIGLYLHPEEDTNQRYMAWAASFKNPKFPTCDPGFIVNNFVRDWGHQFIYDKNTLTLSLVAAGFVDIKSFRFRKAKALICWVLRMSIACRPVSCN